MAMKQTGRKVYKSMQGKSVDMDLLRQRNELTPAVGNARVNARGDELGPGGKIIRRRDEILEEYYRDHPQAVPDESPSKAPEATPTPAPTVKPVVEAVKKSAPVNKVEAEMAEIDQEADETGTWVEDADGNFVKKGE